MAALLVTYARGSNKFPSVVGLRATPKRVRGWCVLW